jgi:uncharacterized spore protein YtfJ
MKHINDLLASISGHLGKLAEGNAVVAKTLSVGDRHVIPLCELSMGFGGGGGIGEGTEKPGEDKTGGASGTGGGAGGGAKANPVAVVVIDGGKVRVESLVK